MAKTVMVCAFKKFASTFFLLKSSILDRLKRRLSPNVMTLLIDGPKLAGSGMISDQVSDRFG